MPQHSQTNMRTQQLPGAHNTQDQDPRQPSKQHGLATFSTTPDTSVRITNTSIVLIIPVHCILFSHRPRPSSFL